MTAEDLGKLITLIHRYGVIFHNRRLSALGLTVGDLSFLLYLRDHQGTVQEDIADGIGLNKSNVTRGLCHLEDKGLIRREGDLRDRRKIRVYVSDAGWALMHHVVDSAQEWSRRLSEDMDSQGLRQAQELLTLMAANAAKSAKS